VKSVQHPRCLQAAGAGVVRRKPLDGQVPPHLASFDEESWLGRTTEQRFSFWVEARVVYFEAHAWPGGPLAFAAGASDVRRRLAGQRLYSWGRTPDEPERLEAGGQ